MTSMDAQAKMFELIEYTISQQASDLHLIAGSPPMIRVHGELLTVNDGVLTPEVTEALVMSILTEDQKKSFQKDLDHDMSYQYKDKSRFRVNVYHQKNSVSIEMRLLNSEVLTIDQLRLPAVCHQITQLKQGLVLMTGPTGSGKTTSLASMIEEINRSRAEHIVTVEDPVEYVFTPKKSIISQKEMGHDTTDWTRALRSTLREDPNVVLVGEMRDFETIAAALTMAETGHLVFATLHTNSAAQTIDRIIDVFPVNQQPQVRNQLAMSLEAVFAQRLVPAVQGGRVPAVEVMLASSAVRSSIREQKTFQLDNIIQTSAALGMMTLETSLLYWVKSGVLSMEKAREFAIRPEELTRAAKQS